jgi:His/Glu/Gln/Arg/opine family amino acid ABC transporter permease subunit
MININLLLQGLPDLVQGLMVSLQIAGLSCFLGITLGVCFAILQFNNSRIVRWSVGFLVGIIRGTPMLIQILFFYYALPYWGLHIDAFWIAVVAIGFNSSAYISQILRSGIQSIPKGQLEAAQVLGLKPFDTIRFIILPQTLALIVPSLGNEFVTLVKDSSLASIIGVAELSKEGRIIISRTYDAITIFAGIALLYLIVTTTVSWLMLILERRMRKHAQHN